MPLALLFLLFFAVSPLSAQSTRSQFTFHVYVNPILGDDYAATCLNPGVIPSGAWTGTLTSIAPGATHIDPNMPRTAPNGPLQHAPYAFKTLTTNTSVGGAPVWGAIEWVRRRIGAFPFPNGIQWVVIHCLPGLYGPVTSQLPALDPASGLSFNGEPNFPVQLPHRVSLQGASALDTILDARGQQVAIIEVTELGAANHNQTFIDGFTIRNAQSNGMCTPPNNHTGSGIAIWGEGASALAISNCFIVNNTVGITIDTDQDPQFIHRPQIVNNTIAFNGIGLYNGNLYLNQPRVGFGQPILLNNIFDAPASSPAAFSAFEGLTWFELTVASVTTSTGPVTPVPATFNAWQPGRANLGIGGCPYVAVALRMGVPQPPPGWGPNVDITPFTGTATLPRGSLYINDIFRNDTSTPTLSPHDYRLAFHVSTSPAVPGPFPGSLNPLINTGISTGVTTPSGAVILSITMQNGGGVGAAPGLPANAEDPPATYNAWDYDCDGYGNPRVIQKCMFPLGVWGGIDYGADEGGELTISGYLDNTRMFSFAHACAPTIPSRSAAYFFNVNHPTVTSYLRPNFNLVDGQGFRWYEHITYPAAPPPGCASGVNDTLFFGCLSTTQQTNYTNGGTGWRGAIVKNGVPGNGARNPLFMRSLACDFSPFLIQDVHPLWGTQLMPNDVYAALPWYNNISSGVVGLDNPFLFYNPQVGTNPPPSNDLYGVQWHKIDVGMINPPGTYWIGAGASVLMPGLPVFSSWRWTCAGGAGGATTYSVNAWGYGDTGASCPDVVPSTVAYQGTRHNLEVPPNQTCPVDGNPLVMNLQTFLAITIPPPAPTGPCVGRLPPFQTVMKAIEEARKAYKKKRKK